MNSKRQKIVIVCGASATGKTSVMKHVIKHMKRAEVPMAVAKIDCLDTEDDVTYSKLNVPTVVGLSKDLCPDHYLVGNLEDIVNWSKSKSAELLIIETAGLCSRCAPATEKTLSVCIVDCLSGIKIPRKLGPMLTTADIAVITKGDMVSQAEREVFIHNINSINRKAKIIEVNGVSGAGSEVLAHYIVNNDGVDSIEGDNLRHSMPCATCSYCVGETRVGNCYQQGILKKMVFT